MKKLVLCVVIAALLVTAIGLGGMAAANNSQPALDAIDKINQKLEAKRQAGLPIDNPDSRVSIPDPQTMQMVTQTRTEKVWVERRDPEEIIELNKEYLDFITQTLGPEAAEKVKAELVKSSQEIPAEGQEIEVTLHELSFVKKIEGS